MELAWGISEEGLHGSALLLEEPGDAGEGTTGPCGAREPSHGALCLSPDFGTGGAIVA